MFVTEKELVVYNGLRKGGKTNSFKVYIKEEFPPDDHYASNENVQELIVVADEGFAFTADMKDRMKELDKKANRTSLSLKNVYGLSGYNRTLSSMQTLVMARGPQFAIARQQPSGSIESSEAEDLRVEVVDLFALLCNLLEVKAPTSASGQINRVKSFLRYHPSDTGNQVVKVIRNWMDFALMPENVPITSE